MLSWSAQANQVPVDLLAVTDPTVDPALPGGRALLGFIDAAVNRDRTRLALARSELGAVLGDEAVIRAAAVVANFQMMNRIADATGMPVSNRRRAEMAAVITRLGLDRFDHAPSR